MDDKKKIIDENKKDRSIMFAGIAIIIQILWFIMRKDINLGLIGFVCCICFSIVSIVLDRNAVSIIAMVLSIILIIAVSQEFVYSTLYFMSGMWLKDFPSY